MKNRVEKMCSNTPQMGERLEAYEAINSKSW